MTHGILHRLRAVVLVLPPALAAATPVRSAAQDSIRWTRTVPVTGVPAGRTLRWPSLAARGDTLFVAANHVPQERSGVLGRSPAVLLRVPGGALRMPPGTFTFTSPRGVFDDRGVYHLLWGEPPDARYPPRHLTMRVAELWHATYRDGRWSRPERLLKGTALSWGGNQSDVAVDAAGGVHVVVPAVTSDGRFALEYLRMQRSGWRQHEWATQATYATIAASGGKSLIVVYVAPDPTVPGNTNSLFATRSPDGGDSWITAALLRGSPGTVAIDPRLVAGSTGMHLFWLDATAGSPGSGKTLTHWVSRDAGQSWRADSAAALSGSVVLRYVAAVTPCGHAHVIADELTGDAAALRAVLDHVTWEDASPTTTRLFSQDVGATGAGLLARGDTLELLASVAHTGKASAQAEVFRAVDCGAPFQR